MGSSGAVEASPETRGLFIGRRAELAELQAALPGAVAGRGQLFLLSGDAGLGKTSLADRLAMSSPPDALVLWGRSWEEPGAPPHWPWIQIIRECLREFGADTCVRMMGTGAGDIAGIVPEVQAAIADAVVDEHVVGDRGRFELFDALNTFLMAVSQERPLVVVLDDLHTMDLASLHALHFVARQVRQLRALMVCTCRHVDVTTNAERSDLLDRIAREATTLRLGGLRTEEVQDLLEIMLREPAPASLAAEVQRLTEGNPLFVTELARMLAAGGVGAAARRDPAVALATNESVRHTIRRRLDLLPADGTEVLSIAAVCGREFDEELVVQVSAMAPRVVADLLAEARRVAVLSQLSAVSTRYRFHHVLIRDVLYESLAPPDRMQLHLRIAQALEERRDGTGTRVGELAHHYLQAAHAGVAAEAVRHATLAAEDAGGQFAWDEAADWYRRALEAFDLQDAADAAEKCDLLIRLGRALASAGRGDEARSVFVEAAAQARTAGSGRHLAEAALGYGWVAITTGVSDQVLVAMLEEGLAALGDDVTALRVDVMTRLVLELLYVAEPEQAARRAALAAHATELARTLGEPLPLIYALEAGAWAGSGPDNVEQRIEAGSEILRLAHQHDLVTKATPIGHLLRFPAQLEIGDVAAAEHELAAYERVAETLREPDLLWYVTSCRAAMAMMAGRFDEAQRAAHRALEIGEPTRADEARQYHGVQMLTLLRERGATDDLAARVDEFEQLAAQYPALPAIRAAVGCAYAAIGRDAAARATLQRLETGSPLAEVRNTTWLAALALTAELCAHLGAAGLARVLYGQLKPYATQQVVFDAAVVCLGPVTRYLGLLASTAGDLEASVAHLEHAIEDAGRTGARPYRAHAEHELARVLLDRDGPGDHAAAVARAASALETARELGMAQLVDAAAAVLGTREELEPPTAVEVSSPSTAEFRREGALWAVGFDGERKHVGDLIGFKYLARLLGNPGVEVHVLDLVAGAGEGATSSAMTAAQDGLTVTDQHAGPVLDGRAKAEYRQRVADLREEIDDAEAMNDLGRAAKAREEMDFLLQELSAAVGLGGRDRVAASDAERARVNVTRTLRRAIDHIAEVSDGLGAHLAVSVETGTFCSYRPDPHARIEWDVLT